MIKILGVKIHHLIQDEATYIGLHKETINYVFLTDFNKLSVTIRNFYICLLSITPCPNNFQLLKVEFKMTESLDKIERERI